MVLKNSFKIVGYLFVLLVLTSCHRGIDNLPQLSQIVFNAIKSGEFSKIQKVLPDKQAMSVYLEQYEINQYKDDSKRTIESGSRVKIINTRIHDQVTLIHSSTKISWMDATLKNYQYEENDTKYGYLEGLGKLEIKSSAGTKFVKFQARKVNGLWFLYDGLELLD